MWELTKSFRFEAAHSLTGTVVPGEEIHGHSYRAEVALRGVPDPTTGMIVDTGMLEQRIAEIRSALDHKLLDRVQELGTPTLENLARFVWDRIQCAGNVARVTIYRDSCDESCSYFGPVQTTGTG
ncbi:MAG: 6-pyruvoyl trahydropterin synthase family protein [Xanthobacteraceae bacterium]